MVDGICVGLFLCLMLYIGMVGCWIICIFVFCVVFFVVSFNSDCNVVVWGNCFILICCVLKVFGVKFVWCLKVCFKLLVVL